MRYFCTKFLTGKEQRLDAIIFAHEHKHVGSPSFLSTTSVAHDQKARDISSLATFLITTLLLPALLVAPSERDIRIINVVNPFYAAASGLPFSPIFTYDSASLKSDSLFLREGHRSLRTIVLTRHLQRVLDALPQASQVPKPEEGSGTVPVASSKLQKSNIVSVTVSPGMSRIDTLSYLLNADWNTPTRFSYLGISMYVRLFSHLSFLKQIFADTFFSNHSSEFSQSLRLPPCKLFFMFSSYQRLSRFLHKRLDCRSKRNPRRLKAL